ncbi:hypothetical protein OF83DRAFT_1170359 [Amylostereum chailletii]|nr:hypothetical protein OF83DRAFT_1170359 [Amylostereum chailletii]
MFNDAHKVFSPAELKFEATASSHNVGKLQDHIRHIQIVSPREPLPDFDLPVCPHCILIIYHTLPTFLDNFFASPMPPLAVSITGANEPHRIQTTNRKHATATRTLYRYFLTHVQPKRNKVCAGGWDSARIPKLRSQKARKSPAWRKSSRLLLLDASSPPPPASPGFGTAWVQPVISIATAHVCSNLITKSEASIGARRRSISLKSTCAGGS